MTVVRFDKQAANKVNNTEIDIVLQHRKTLVLAALKKAAINLDRRQLVEKAGISKSVLAFILPIMENEGLIKSTTSQRRSRSKDYYPAQCRDNIAGSNLFYPMKQPIYQSPTTGIFATMTPRKPQPVIETKPAAPAPISQVTSEKVFDVCGMKVEITTNEKIKRFPINKYDLVFDKLKVGEFLKCNEENLNAFRNAMVRYVKRKKLKNRVFSSLKIKDGYGRLWLE